MRIFENEFSLPHFLRGIVPGDRIQFDSLEEALMRPLEADAHDSYIDLTKKENTYYFDAEEGFGYIRYTDSKGREQVQTLDHSYVAYMQEYGDKVQRVSMHGTPLLTQEEANDPDQFMAYQMAERFLIDLDDPDVEYESEFEVVDEHGNPVLDDDGNPILLESHAVTFTRHGQRLTIPVDPEFITYMDMYGPQTLDDGTPVNGVRFITSNGTPWLTEHEALNDGQFEDYYEALKGGPKQDVAIVEWRKTNLLKKETGHAGLAVGHLELGEGPDDISASISGMSSEISGDKYPASGLFTDKQVFLRTTKHYPTEQYSRLVGNVSRKALAVATAGAGVGAKVGWEVGKGVANAVFDRGKKIGEPILKIGSAIGLGTVSGWQAGRAARLIGVQGEVEQDNGEDRGHGVLATLITPAQADIMAHRMYGMNRTFLPEDYSILKANCADHVQSELLAIGLDAGAIVRDAWPNDPKFGKVGWLATQLIGHPRMQPARWQTAVSGFLKKPDRTGYEAGAFNMQLRDERRTSKTEQLSARKAGEKVEEFAYSDETETEMVVTRFDVSGQSALLFHRDDGEAFGCPPQAMLAQAFKEAISVVDVPENWELQGLPAKESSRFGFNDRVQVLSNDLELLREEKERVDNAQEQLEQDTFPPQEEQGRGSILDRVRNRLPFSHGFNR